MILMAWRRSHERFFRWAPKYYPPGTGQEGPYQYFLRIEIDGGIYDGDYIQAGRLTYSVSEGANNNIYRFPRIPTYYGDTSGLYPYNFRGVGEMTATEVEADLNRLYNGMWFQPFGLSSQEIYVGTFTNEDGVIAMAGPYAYTSCPAFRCGGNYTINGCPVYHCGSALYWRAISDASGEGEVPADTFRPPLSWVKQRVKINTPRRFCVYDGTTTPPSCESYGPGDVSSEYLIDPPANYTYVQAVPIGSSLEGVYDPGNHYKSIWPNCNCESQYYSPPP